MLAVLPLLAVSFALPVAPHPASAELGTGTWKLTPECAVGFDGSSPDGESMALFVRDRLLEATGLTLPVRAGSVAHSVFVGPGDARFGPEEYVLEISASVARLTGNARPGLVWALETLL